MPPERSEGSDKCCRRLEAGEAEQSKRMCPEADRGSDFPGGTGWALPRVSEALPRLCPGGVAAGARYERPYKWRQRSWRIRSRTRKPLSHQAKPPQRSCQGAARVSEGQAAQATKERHSPARPAGRARDYDDARRRFAGHLSPQRPWVDSPRPRGGRPANEPKEECRSDRRRCPGQGRPRENMRLEDRQPSRLRLPKGNDQARSASPLVEPHGETSVRVAELSVRRAAAGSDEGATIQMAAAELARPQLDA